MCIEAVKSYGYALKDVPENLRNDKICLEAVKEDYNAIEFVPEPIKSE